MRSLTARKKKMYETVLKKIDSGTYFETAEPAFESLYQDSKTWRQHSKPTKFRINIDERDPTGTNAALDAFSHKKIR